MQLQDHLLFPCRVIASPNQDARPDVTDISLIVIHSISLPPQNYGGGYIEDLFLNRLDSALHPYFSTIAELKVSSHLVIDRAGVITQYVPFDRRAWHAGISSFEGRERCNDFSIGIELEGCDTDAFTDVQYIALIPVLKLLQQTYPETRQHKIVGHETIAPGRKTDPGPFFEWSKLAAEGLFCV